MASYTERLRVLIDVSGDKATASLQNFRKSVADAQGFTGKLKAGVGSLKQSLTGFIPSPAMAATAIAAVGTVAIKAANELSALAKQAIDLGKATGLSTEEASRWIALGDDYEVSAEALTTSIGRIGKTLDTGTWEKYGIATRDAGGNARSTNDILLDAIDVLSKTKNETERARIGNQLFGKGHASIAPLIGKTRAEYELMLGAVEDGQVITAKEAEKAEKWRLAQDKLNDALGELKLAAGEAAVELAPLVDLIAEVLTYGRKLDDNPFVGFLEDIFNPIQRVSNAWEKAKGVFSDNDEIVGAFDEQAVATKKAYDAAKEYYQSREAAARGEEEVARATDDATRAVEDFLKTKDPIAQYPEQFRRIGEALRRGVAPDAEDLADVMAGLGVTTEKAFDMAWNAMDRTQSKYKELLGEIDDEQAFMDVEDSIADLEQAMVDAYTAGVEGADDFEEKQREATRQTNKTKKELLEYLEGLGRIPASTATKVMALIDAGKYAEAERLMKALSNPRVVELKPRVVGSPTFFGMRQYATGTPAAKPGLAVVGENGPELVDFNGGERVLSGQTSAQVLRPTATSSAPTNVTLNVTVTNPVASGEQLANELAAYTRRNGTRWLGVS